MRTVLSRLGPRFGIDGVEQPSVLVYALPHEAQRQHGSRVMLSVIRQQAVPERRRCEQGRCRRVPERVRLVNVVQERPVFLLRAQRLSRVNLRCRGTLQRTWYFHTPVSISSIHCVRLFFCGRICEEKLDRLIVAQTRIMPAAAQAFPTRDRKLQYRPPFPVGPKWIKQKLTHQLPSDQCPPKTLVICVATGLHLRRRGHHDTSESGRTRFATTQVPRSHSGGHQNMR